MRVLKRILLDKKGSSYPLIIALVFAILLISSVVFEYMRLVIITKGIRDAVQQAVISVAVDNYDKIYNGLREGYSGGYDLLEQEWKETFSLGDVYSRLDSLLGLRKERNYHIKYTSGVVEYKLSDLFVNIKNVPIAPAFGYNTDEFSAEANILIEVPLSFGWDMLPNMKINLKSKAEYIPKF